MTPSTFRPSALLPLLTSVLPLLILGCGPVEERSEPATPGVSSQELGANNSLTLNGLAFNGLAFNGLAFNGLAFNGLAFNGLSSQEFTSWFQADPDLASQVMRYMIQCAVPAGEVRTYTDGQRTHTWEGLLGLAPGWASGSPATQAEQQLISACLAAHANKYGMSVAISVLGNDVNGQPIPYTSSELTDFSVREACFFGNFFASEGVFVGNDASLLHTSKSSLRACALTTETVTSGDREEDGEEEDGECRTAPVQCAPLAHVGSCQTYCTRDASGTYYTHCTRNGITYKPITTRIRSQDIYTCGDGVCQPSESCGYGSSAKSCRADCGSCP